MGISFLYKLLFIFLFGFILITISKRKEIKNRRNINIVSGTLYYLIKGIDFLYWLVDKLSKFFFKIPGTNYAYNKLELVNNYFVEKRNNLLKWLFKILLKNSMDLYLRTKASHRLGNNEEMKETLHETRNNKGKKYSKVFENDEDMMKFLDNIVDSQCKKNN